MLASGVRAIFFSNRTVRRHPAALLCLPLTDLEELIANLDGLPAIVGIGSPDDFNFSLSRRAMHLDDIGGVSLAEVDGLANGLNGGGRGRLHGLGGALRCCFQISV